MAKSVFYSFDYSNDAARVQLVCKMNALEGQPLLDSQDWEKVRAAGDEAIKKWINEQMSYKKTVIVLIGKNTAGRPWVQYEIVKAWADKKPLLGIRIHGLSSFGNVDVSGPNPFDTVNGLGSVPVFDPTVKNGSGTIDSTATYGNLLKNLESWAGQGVTKPLW